MKTKSVREELERRYVNARTKTTYEKYRLLLAQLDEKNALQKLDVAENL